MSPEEIAKAVEDEVLGVAREHQLTEGDAFALLASTFRGLLVQCLEDPAYKQTLVTRFTK